MKQRQRGRNRRSSNNNNNPNRHFESTGPDVKIRGSAQQILDKYLQYARDAQSSGERINSENYYQHAEHYARLIAAMQPKEKPRDARDGQGEERDASAETAEAEAAAEGAETPDALKVIDEDQDAADAPAPAEPKPRRRRSYRRKDDMADAEDAPAGGDESGVLKTLSRGGPIAETADGEADTAPADAPIEAAE